MDYKVSVIVPVYNCKKYLRRAVDSIVSQSCFKDIEMILVDDGSSDGSSEICDSYGKLHSNIKVIHQQNSGVSAARNRGLDASTGTWICFLDSDDYYLSDSFDNLLKCKESDMICAGYESNTTIRSDVFKTFSSGLYVINDISTELDSILASNNSLYTCWGKLFKKSIIEENYLRFPVDLAVGEDMVFVYTYFLYCKTIFMFDKPVYYYYVNVDNTTSVVMKSFDTLLFIYNWKTDYFKNKNSYTDLIKDRLIRAFVWQSFFALKTSATYMKFNEGVSYLQNVLENESFYKLYLDVDFRNFSTLTDKLMDRYIRKRNSFGICLLFKVITLKTKVYKKLKR